jgi:transposase-like protein
VQGKELQVAKRRVGRYPKEFRQKAVERLKSCDNIVESSQELGVHRRHLYKWRDQFDPFDPSEKSPPENSRESTLRKEINQLTRVLVDKTLELDFSKGALQKVEARRLPTTALRLWSQAMSSSRVKLRLSRVSFVHLRPNLTTFAFVPSLR